MHCPPNSGGASSNFGKVNVTDGSSSSALSTSASDGHSAFCTAITFFDARKFDVDCRNLYRYNVN